MKRINYLLVVLAAFSMLVACKNVTYKKSKSGLLYKIFPAKGKDPLVKNGQWIKVDFSFRYNDSLLYDSRGKMPGYVQIQPLQGPVYDLVEILPLMKEGDSAVTVQISDTLLKMGARNLPPNAKKGGRLVCNFRIVKVFANDSLYQKDITAEQQRDMPRQMKERQEQMAKEAKEEEKRNEVISKQIAHDADSLIKSGEAAKEIQSMETYLAKKKISAQKTPRGVFVEMQQPGTGAQAAIGKYVRIKYTGKIIATDSTFDSNTFALKIGISPPMILGFTEGLQAFKQGGKGTIYIPGFLAYGKQPGRFKPSEPLKFDVEMLEVSDSLLMQQPQPPPGQ